MKKLMFKAMLIVKTRPGGMNRIKGSMFGADLAGAGDGGGVAVADAPCASVPEAGPSAGSGQADEHLVYAVVATDSVDSDGDVLLMSGANISEYARNPLFYYGHPEVDERVVNTSEFNIGKCIGVWLEAKSLTAALQFDRAAGSLGDRLYGMYRDGRMNQFSVGFEEDEVSTKKSCRTSSATPVAASSPSGRCGRSPRWTWAPTVTPASWRSRPPQTR